MALTVNSNLASTTAVTSLSKTSRSLQASFARVSSGLRIASAADDAAGLGVAENLSAKAQGLRQAMRNTNDGVSVIEVAESAAGEVSNILKRMRELAVQSASETLENTERGYIQTEFAELASEVDRLASVSEFNGVQLGDGSVTTIAVQVGAGNTANDQISVSLGDLRGTTLGVDIASIDMSTAANASTALTGIDAALDVVNGYRATYGASTNRLESALRNLETYTEKIEGAESRIRDADFAYESAEMSKYQIMQQAGLAVLGQANQLNQGALRLLG
ncbi:MAG: flagellin [Myxococcota bacterium]